MYMLAMPDMNQPVLGAVPEVHWNTDIAEPEAPFPGSNSQVIERRRRCAERFGRLGHEVTDAMKLSEISPDFKLHKARASRSSRASKRGNRLVNIAVNIDK